MGEETRLEVWVNKSTEGLSVSGDYRITLSVCHVYIRTYTLRSIVDPEEFLCNPGS